MPALARSTPLTPDEYLALEAECDVRHEYINGEMVAMAGGTDWHNAIVFNAAVQLQPLTRPRDCRVLRESVKLRVERANAYFYPDVFVSCDKRDEQDRLVKRHASLIIEVLSPSTEVIDRTSKFTAYRKLDSLLAYVLIETAYRRVEVYERQDHPFWRWSSFVAGEVARIDTLDLALAVDDLYLDTDVPVDPPVEPTAAPRERRGSDD